MPKLIKDKFDLAFRFRESREAGLVACVNCAHISGEKDVTGAFCIHGERVRKIQIASAYCRDPRSSWHTAKKSVCDAFTSKPLPADVVSIVFKKGEGVVLGTQFADCIHVDANCPYVIEEQRLAKSGGRSEYCNRSGEVRIIDISEEVPGEVHGDACEMPCCESVMQSQIWDPNGYRTRVSIHPNAHDPKRFVRNGITKHGSKSNMNYEEAEAFFNGVKKVALAAAGREIHDPIVAVSNYIHRHVNFLGSRPLSEAVNPVFLWPGAFHILAVPNWLKDSWSWKPYQNSANTGADIWVYDERLFDRDKELEAPLAELSRIPEGIIPCMDSKGVLRNVNRVDERYRTGENFHLSGILRPLENQALLAKGLTHFVDIREVSYKAHEHIWGESGIGFSATASFHEQ